MPRRFIRIVEMNVLMAFVYSAHASGYPSAVVFIPSANVLPYRGLRASSYVPLNVHPDVMPGASGVGFGAGLVPTIHYPNGASFGGFEAGVDIVNGAYHRGGTKYVKPVFNAKLGFLLEGRHWPAAAFGLMSFAPFQRSESLNHCYLSLSKTLMLSEITFGTVTLGTGYAAGAKRYSYAGSPQLGHTRNTLFAGFGSPQWRQFSVYIDSVTGTSDMSSTNVALGYSAAPSAFLMVGTYWANNRRLPKAQIYDGVFASFTVRWEPWAQGT